MTEEKKTERRVTTIHTVNIDPKSGAIVDSIRQVENPECTQQKPEEPTTSGDYDLERFGGIGSQRRAFIRRHHGLH